MPRSSLFFRPVLILAALLLGAGIALRDVPSAAESARSVPPPALDTPANARATSEVAILAGGCFWGVQGVFQHVQVSPAPSPVTPEAPLTRRITRWWEPTRPDTRSRSGLPLILAASAMARFVPIQ